MVNLAIGAGQAVFSSMPLDELVLGLLPAPGAPTHRTPKGS